MMQRIILVFIAAAVMAVIASTPAFAVEGDSGYNPDGTWHGYCPEGYLPIGTIGDGCVSEDSARWLADQIEFARVGVLAPLPTGYDPCGNAAYFAIYPQNCVAV